MPRDLFAEAGIAPVQAPPENFQPTESGLMPTKPEMVDTRLSPQDEQGFAQWKAQNSPDDSGFDYDLRGAYMADRAGKLPKDDSGRGHMPDTYKKPWHPTYSTDSGVADPNGLKGGAWSQDAQGRTVFTPGPANLKYHSADELRNYFSKVEPDAVLNLPSSTGSGRDLFSEAGIKPLPTDPGDRARDRMDRLDRSIGTVASDLAKKAAAGANAMVDNIADLYGIATGDVNNPVSQQAKSGQEYWNAQVSPELKAQEAARKAKIDAASGEWAKAGTAIWETLKNPALLSSSLAEQAAQLVPVGAAGRAAGAVAKIAGAGRAAAGTAAVAGGVTAGAAMQGADTGGDAYDRLMALPDPIWAQNEDVRALVMGGMDIKRAKEAVATRLSRNSAAVAAIASGALNLIPGARTLEKAMSGVPVVGGTVNRAVSGLAGEAAQEGLEESSGMAAQNYAVKQVDPTQSLKQGVGEAGGIGAVVGGPMGGVTGALAQQEQVSQPDVQPGTQPAANEPSVSDLIGEDVGTPNVGALNKDGGTTFPAQKLPEHMAAPPQVGDLVQWESGGQLQFQEPRRVTGITDHEGQLYATVEGSNTGIPLQELSVQQGQPSTLSPADQRVREIRDAVNAGRPVPPSARNQAQEVDVEDVEAAPAPVGEPLVNAAEDMQTEINALPPANNIDVNEQAMPVENIEAAPPPVEQPVVPAPPASNVDVNEQPVEEIDAAPPPDIAIAANSRASRLPPDWTDNRLARAQYRYGLRHMADSIEKGGGVAYKQDENGTITGRTPSLNPSWYQAMQQNPDYKMSVAETQKAVTKALAGEKLGVREARVVGAMLEQVHGERGEQVDYAKQQLEAARKFRKTAAEAIGITDEDVSRAGEMFQEREYRAHWDGPTRSLYELADDARAIDKSAADSILESSADNATVARKLAEIIHGRAEQRAQGDPGETQGGRKIEAPAEAQGAQEARARGPEDGAVKPPPKGARAQLEAKRAKKTEQPTSNLPAKQTQLYVEFGGRRYPVGSMAEASDKWNQVVSTSGAGASEIGGQAFVTDESGKKVARISYNGRLWEPGEGGKEIVPNGRLGAKEALAEARKKSDAIAREFEAKQIAPYTAADLAERETQKAEAETKRRDAETKAKADEQRGAFTLAGSDREADQAAAAGQQDLLASKPVEKPEASKPLYASRPVTNAADIIDWAKQQGFPSTLSPDDLHVTVAYSREPVKGESVKATAGKLSTTEGKRSVEKLGDEGAVVLKFESPDLQKRWQEYRDAGASWDYDKYMPHVTITYDGGKVDLSKVKPYSGPIHLGDEKQEALNVDKADDYKATEKPTTAKPAAAKIEDFGSKLEGARKDYASRLKEAKDVDIAKEPLSKSWPEPDYDKLIEEGANPAIVAFVHAARDEIPTKPQRSYKLSVWVERVKLLRDFSEKLISGEIDAARLAEQLEKPGFANVAEQVGGRASLYERVGHAKSLRGIGISAGKYTLYEGKKYDPPKVIWTVDKKAKATAFSNWPTTLGKGDTKQAAIDDFVKKFATMDAKVEKDISFSIYAYKSKPGTAVIGKKIGSSYIDLKEFDSAAEAREYLAKRKDELIALLNQKKNIPSERRANNEPRVGIDHRGGADVTPEQFTETFGFRGVQFGNYVESVRRQADLNEAYDALMDMAGILGIPPRAISLNGEMGLAFGARGRGGNAAAHYEPDTIVINLTKGHGAGSLAHEWWHGLDNYFARQGGRKSEFVTDGNFRIDIRPEMIEAFKGVRSAINNASLKKRSRNLDARRSKPYWATGLELSARSFESYVIAKLHDQGQSNDYLANIVDENFWNAAIGEDHTYPYPTADEVPAIRAAFDEFFRTVETRETDKGVGMFAASFDAEDDGFSAALKFISEHDEAFTYPKSTAKDFEQVAKDVSAGAFTDLKVTKFPSASKTSKEEARYIISIGAKDKKGRVRAAQLRQYKNGTLELDISDSIPGDAGSAIYQMVGDFAHNTSRVFVGDRHGLSATAQIRRTEAMLSSALRWGTTQHLHPHDLQVSPEVAGVRPLGWKVGNDAHNMRELARTQFETMIRLVPEIRGFDYNSDTGQFVDKAGKEISDAKFQRLAELGRVRPLESAAHQRSLGYPTPSGRRSLKRSVWLRWLSREASGPGWGRLLAGLSQQHAESSGSGSTARIIPPKIAYARGESATSEAPPSAGLSASGVRDYLTAKMGPRAIRSLIDSGKFKIVLSDDNELPPRARAAVSENKRIYGYFDPATQTSYIIADRLTDAGKKTGILEDAYSIFLHEVGVHYGMRQMLGDAMFNRVVAEVAAAAENGEGALGEAAAAARKRMSKKTLPEDVNEETLAWLVTDRANHKLNILQKVIAKIRAFLVSKGFTKAISPDALVELARGAAMRAGGQSISAVEDGDKFAASDSNDVETAIKQPAAKARTGLRQRARAIVKAIDAKLTPLATMEGRTEYLTSRYLTLGRIAQTQQEARRVYDLFRKLSDADGAKVYAYLTDTEGTLEGVDPAVKANATRVKAKIEETGKALVERGVIPLASFQKYEGRYLPRVYLAYLLGDKAVKAVGAGKTLSQQSYAKSRDENLPQEYRDLVLGEIKDPAFLASRALGVPLRDLAILNWLSQIAENPSWVLPGQTVEWTMPGFEKARKVTPYWLKSEATSLRERAQHYQGQNKVDAMRLAAEMDATADAALSEAGIAIDQVPDGYKQIPNSSRYGAVRGLIVKADIYDDIVGAGQVSADQNIIKRIFEGDIGRKAVSMWKISKVSLNPPAQIRNIISNMVMLHLSGVPMHKLPGYIARAAKEIRTKGRFYQIGVKYGITESTFAAQEMQRIERETMDYLMRSKGRFSVAGLKDYASRLVEWAGDKYQFSEMLGKLVKIMDSMEREGKSEADAAMAAQEWLFDYSLVGPNVRHLRSAPIGAPFITFATKVLPRMLEVAITAPWRFLPYYGLFYASSLALQAMTGADDDDLEKLKNSLPEWLQDRGHVMMLPFKDENGRWQFVDLGYFFPWTYWTELVTGMGGAVKDLFTEGHSDKFGKALMGSGILGGPIQDLIVAIKTGVDSFSGKDIADEHMTGGQWWAAIGTYLYGMAAPPWLTSKGAAGHIYEALTGSVNKDGTPRDTLSQAALRMVGANIYPVEPEKSRQQNILHKRYDIQKTKSLMTHIARDKSLDPDKRDELVKDYKAKIFKDVAALNQYIKDSAISPKLR